MEPLIIGADMGLPIIDGDGMGRAFPELQMYIPSIEGHITTPAVLTDEKVIVKFQTVMLHSFITFNSQGFSLAVMNCNSPKHLEDILRLNVVNFMG